MKHTCLLLIVSLLLTPAFVDAQKIKVATSAVPAWVKPINFEYKFARLEKQAEGGYFDVAYIKQVNLPEQTVYTRKAHKIINKEGAETLTQTYFPYDPTYQKLTFHDLRIIRNGQTIDKLKNAKFIFDEYETESKWLQYDGLKDAILVLDDLRVGDIVEYAFSVKGFNPLFEARYSDKLYAAFGTPVGQVFYRLLTDAARTVYIENLNLDATAKEYRNGNVKEYEWTFTEVKAVKTEDNLPLWYDGYPTIMVSEYNDWLNIRQWAAALFPNKVAIESGLKKKIDAIKANHLSPAERAVAALNFVQDDIEYISTSLGSGTHRPSDPNKTFTRGYGDSKDKTYLLVTMLNALQIPATPVLVNSNLKHSISKHIPSPKAFNHITVRLTIDGEDHYVDPTLTNQRGSLQMISYPYYATGLVLADSVKGLTTITAPEPGMVNVNETFTIRDMDGHATLMVTTVNTGTHADVARTSFSTSSISEMQEQYKKFYANYFPKIKSDSINYEDDERTGAFTVYEYYTIEELWSIEDGVKKCSFYPYLISSYLVQPADKLRTMPMAIYYPVKYREEVIIKLPSKWELDDFEREINNNIFSYRGVSRLNDRTLSMVFNFETFRDYAEPKEIKLLLADYNKANETMGWQLTYNAKGLSSFTTKSPALSDDNEKDIKVRLAIFFSVLVGVVVFLIARQRRKQSRNEPFDFRNK